MSGESRNPCNFGTGPNPAQPSPVAAPSSGALWVTIEAASYGRLARIVVVQEAGSLDGFTVDIFNSTTAQSVSTPQIEKFRLVPTLTAAGSAAFVQSFAIYPYCCADGSNYDRSREIFFKITPAVSNTGKTFSVGITVE